MAISLKSFLRAHGGTENGLISIGQADGFVSLKTMDGACFLSFARDQEFLGTKGRDLNLAQVQGVLKSMGSQLEVLQGTNQTGAHIGEVCYTIVTPSIQYDAFTF